MSLASLESLGVDIGGVIISRPAASADTAFAGHNYLDTPEEPGAIDALTRLVRERFGTRAFIISKAGSRTRARTVRWLKHHRFFERTGILPKHVYFCLERGAKAEICRRLGITHFIDDRADVLRNLATVSRRYLFGHNSGGERRIICAQNWDEVLRNLLP